MEVIPTPVVGHGMLFCSSGRAGPTLAIRPGGQGDVTNTHLVWSSPRGSPFVPSPILYGGQLYMVNDMQSIVTSFEAVTGRSLWQGRLGVAQREGFSASTVAFDAVKLAPADPRPAEELASIVADAGDADRLAPLADSLATTFPDRPDPQY